MNSLKAKKRWLEEGGIKDRHYQGKYGITLAQYNDMLAAQGGVCALCRRDPKLKKRFSVDHDHMTGRIRGLLCMRCNTAIGHLLDEPGRALAAAAYLERHASPRPFTFIA